MNFQAGGGQSPQQQQSLAAPGGGGGGGGGAGGGGQFGGAGPGSGGGGPSQQLAGGPPQQFALSNSAAIRAEIQRFESVHPNIYAIYDLIERIEDLALQNQIREHVISIEGERSRGLRKPGRCAPSSVARGPPRARPDPSLVVRGPRAPEVWATRCVDWRCRALVQASPCLVQGHFGVGGRSPLHIFCL
jgi:hypothetical protein